MSSNGPSLSFSGHESFPLRFGWLKKGFDAIRHDPGFFQRPDAMVDLGVGKNMVRAIRHWGLACQVWTDDTGTRGREVQPTHLGGKLLGQGGWDPYLEDPASVWWLHWSLVRSEQKATAWAYVFGERSGTTRFTREQLAAELDDLQKDVTGRRTPMGSLKRDADVLVRSYAGTTRRGASEDAIDSLFSQLGLIRPAAERGQFELLAGDPPSLPPLVVAAAIEDYARARPDRRNLSLDELLYAQLSPGRVFRLTERALIRRLHALRDHGWQFDETAGLREVIRPDGQPDPEAQLVAHYPSAEEQAN